MAQSLAHHSTNSAAAGGSGTENQQSQNFDYMFKLLIIGNSSVGKTSFLFRYCDDSFTSAFVSTVGIDFKVKTVFKGDKRIKLQIWVIQLNNILCNNNYRIQRVKNVIAQLQLLIIEVL